MGAESGAGEVSAQEGGGVRELLVWRSCWNRPVGSVELSVALVASWRSLWLGVSVSRLNDKHDHVWYVCLLPCLPIRIHWKRCHGGRCA